MVDLDLVKHPALLVVLHYPGEFGFGRIPGPSSSLFWGAAAAFFCTTNRGKLLQHKLIRVQCTKKSTRVPVSPVPQYGYSV